jgi:hypothetical protein
MMATRLLLDKCAELRRRNVDDARSVAPEHNVFRLLGLEHAEVMLHSRFLADLLDPYGSHAQGSLFLRGFFNLLADRDRGLAGLVSAAPRPGGMAG